MKARLQVRSGRYRGNDGFLVVGRDSCDRSISIFVRRRETAVLIRESYRSGDGYDVDRIILSEAQL
jgi:hypothetical protein